MRTNSKMYKHGRLKACNEPDLLYRWRIKMAEKLDLLDFGL